MVLFSMMCHHIVYVFDLKSIQVLQKHLPHSRVYRIYKGDFLTALYQIRIVAGAIRKRYKRIKKPPVPVNCPYIVNPTLYLSRFHFAPPLIIQQSLFTFDFLYILYILSNFQTTQVLSVFTNSKVPNINQSILQEFLPALRHNLSSSLWFSP